MTIKQSSFILAIIAMLAYSCSTKDKYINEPGNLVPKTADEDQSIPSIRVNGSLLHSEAFGPENAPLIVAIHGGPGGDYRYLLNCRELAVKGYRVVFYDQRGSGLSQRFPRKSFTSLGEKAVDLMYDELGAVIAYYKKNPQQKVILLGHSWGGMLASGYVGRNPELVDGLIVCEPGGLKWADVEDYVKRSRSFNIWGEALNNVTYLDQFITGKEDQHAILDYKMAMLSSRNEITGEADFDPGSSWRDGAIISGALYETGEKYKTDFSKGLNRFNKPVLFFFSEKNKAYPDSWAGKITAAYNTVEKIKVAGVGHDGIITNTQAWQQITLPAILEYVKNF
ncbi:alpha/beta hydrolase [Niabella hibiscisoli]|uniref:alpha/beta hydrolase n=1 Tax=Niabella hibiscisoli TaxID=1825928 RepID=UPI001F0D49ED|nr:alpha/beta hydrolase [Niabella hibiscisoli]MCH5717578.1 alpha/beta hydrolase [Niabella hibiscisoli]